ncbi:hypothetical protein EQG49_03650 [Periweissella cryptocerci]|uniref:SH3 domain-containing protein n=1 Tax=Periweissella cryptocerci TaxID=2506420 RepID=A0A4P6YSL3_9LACO|nr:hypothetical protein [Periweissella cryptocerci]QBO35617.1 hypothetical protein EQG49_03650 [Periweissella cryptocerci]
MKKIIVTLLTVLAFTTLGSTAVSAKEYMPIQGVYYVKLTKRVKVVKIRNTYPLANSYAVKTFYLKKGTKIKITQPASYNWVRVVKPTKYTYAIDKPYTDTKWFKAIKKYPNFYQS